VARPASIGLAALTLLAGLAAGQPAPPAPPGAGQSPWNTGTAAPPQRPPAEDSTLALRIYDEGLGRGKLPYSPGPPRRDDPAWAADVSAVMTRCPDGNLIITALVIGGQLTPLDNRCPAEPRQEPATAPCDAKTWNCGTKTAP
jgi:hypothetical protein